MGFYVSTLRNIPSGKFNHYIYVVDCSGDSIHTSWINENFNRVSQGLGNRAGIIHGPSDLSLEVLNFLNNQLEDDFFEIEHLLHSATCLIITDNVLAQSQNDVFIIPLTSDRSEDDQIHEYMNHIIDTIIEAISSGKFRKYLNTNAAVKFKIRGKGKILINSINSILELKPNIAGIGININVLIEKIFKL
ncbi:hypothetical protein WH96_16500 [Kiloniella spongiae]|uniref:Uncharacterized protein n=1 Tax=Kiloniella spongiae TaxID=1489064 RepID=A0A0H2MSL5_9PROT|nr:hypothetical protein [Kiloniella spongiae]KLN59645.1 hypothetical protein WH96_16500 [Kiloniella spongiae]